MSPHTTRLALACGIAAAAAAASVLAAEPGAVVELHRPGTAPAQFEVASFSWGTSHPAARGSTACTPAPRAAEAAPNQNSSRTNRGGRTAEVAQPQLTPPPPQNAACIAVFLTKKGYDAYCAKGTQKVMILLTDGMARYTLTDAVIESCGEDSMVLSFKTVERTERPAQQAPTPRPASRPTISGSD